MAVIRRVLLVGLLTGGLVALAIVLHGPVRNAMAEFWLAKLDSASEVEVPDLVAQLGELGDAGIPALTAALGSEREIVARNARRQLAGLLEQWRQLGNRQRTPKLARLAESLAAEVHDFGPTARSDAAHLATRILQWPLDPAVVDRADVVAACETVLRAARTQTATLAAWEPGSLAEMPQENRGSTDRHGERHSSIIEERPHESDSVSPIAKLPGGGLPIEPHAGALVAPETIDTTPVADRSQTAFSATLKQPWPFPTSPGPIVAQTNPPVAIEIAPEIAPSDRSAKPGIPADSSTGAEPRSGSAELSGVDTYELTRLVGADRQTAASARDELRRRGWQQVHFELARHLHDRDPAVRRRLVRVLPLLESVEAVPWLLWLAKDPDADVRAAAIGTLGTTGDPSIVDRVLAIARSDTDERVRRQATLIARRRRETLR